jgi:alpha-lytic protease prodomain-containing protein
MRGTLTPRLVRGFVVVVAVAGLAASGATTAASAQGLSPDGNRSADAARGEAALRAAMERDLGLSGAALDARMAAQAEAVSLDVQLQERLGDNYAGSWFDPDSGSLTVAVTDGRAARVATASGAKVTIVSHSERELTAITDALDSAVEADADLADNLLWWGIDVQSNQVVVTTRAGQADSASSVTAEYGTAVRVETSTVTPTTAQDYPWLDGGIPYGGCSTGFNVRNATTGARYFLTAGHCGTAGNGATAGNGVAIGTFVESWFPFYDDALVSVTNTGYWLQGPFVWTWPGFISLNGFTDAPPGTAICKSGRTTGWTCGTITFKDVSVDYFDNAGNFIGTVHGLTQHNACVRPGDSGGSNVNVSSPYKAEGMSSGAALLPGGVCQATPVSWYFPVADSLAYYGAVYGITLW